MKRLLSLLVLALLLWGCAAAPVPTTAPEDTQVPYYPDLTSLPGCMEYAQVLSEKHGISVHIGDAVQFVTPWDYDLESETEIPIIGRELTMLDRHLSNYPEGMVSTLSQQVGGLHISLVRGIYGKAGLGGLHTAAGLQFIEGETLYIALTPSAGSEYTLYHELTHILDTYILENNHSLDGWDSLNPPGFNYDNDYIQNQYRDGSEYLKPHTRAFIDTYSMSFAAEDKARLMEYAMTEGNEVLFDSPIMQRKLHLLSQAIRETFSLESDPRTFLWEQYLIP